MKSSVLIDGNSIGFAAQMSPGARLSSGDLDTTGIFGFLRSLRLLREEFAGNMMVLWDGRSWRYNAYADYKGNRGADPKIAALRDAWKASRPYVAKLVRLLGLPQLRAANMEADDLAARLRTIQNRQGIEVMLVSSDHDWLQLINDQTSLYDPRKQRRVVAGNFTEVTGLPTPKALAEFKALKGDTSDNIPGVGGIGEKTAVKLLGEYGSVSGFLNVMMTDRTAYAATDARARSLVDDEEKQRRFDGNMELIWLDSSKAPKIEGSNLVPGAFDRNGFEQFCAELAFFSITKDVDAFLAPFAAGNK